MEKFKHTTSFSSTLKTLVSEEKDKYLAMATLIDLADFIPDIDTEKNIDLLPIAFNAFVANRVNKNGDVINTETALEIYKNFINKPINVEHNRERVVGTILTAGFSTFGSDQPLTEEQVKDYKEPFNVTLGGVIWKITNSRLADVIEDSADPTSENYRKISASWELGFTDYNIVVLPEGEKNIENAEFITDASKVQELEEHLKSFGGSGKLDNGKFIYRQVIAGVVPLGIGLTESPAADVGGVLAGQLTEEKPSETEQSQKNSSSHNNKNNVKESKVMKMKIENITDINDDSLQELSATSIADFIRSELDKASEQYKQEMTEAEDSLKSAGEKADTLEKEHKLMADELALVKSNLEELERARAEKEAEELFNQRMSSMDDKYELCDEDREVLASDIKDMNQEDFKAYSNKLAVLLKSKDKAILAEKAEAVAKEIAEKAETKVEDVKEEVAASNEEANEVLDEVVENAENTTEEIPVSSEAEQTLYQKYATAFSLDGFEINTNRR